MVLILSHKLHTHTQTHKHTHKHTQTHSETRHCYPLNAPLCMSARLSAFLVSDPSILHASGFMTYCLACLCLPECVCVSVCVYLEAP